MRLVRVSQRNYKELETSLVTYRQLLPFYAVHSVAKQQFLDELLSVTHRCVGLEDQGRLVALISYRSSSKKLEISNLLLVTNQVSKKRGFHFWVKWLEKLAKFERKVVISIPLNVWDQLIVDKLSNEGYQHVEVTGEIGYFIKQLTTKQD